MTTTDTTTPPPAAERRWILDRERREYVRLIVPADERDDALQYLASEGFADVQQTAPYIFSSGDDRRVSLSAEKEIAGK
jgi:hypothetical protein